MRTLRFDGAIAGVRTASGVRLVVGMWPSSPFGPIVDVMVEDRDGRRVLIAPRADVADFIASTYRFDEVHIEGTGLRIDGPRWTVTTDSLHVTLQVGRRTAVGQLLSLIPRSPASAGGAGSPDLPHECCATVCAPTAARATGVTSTTARSTSTG